MKINFKYQDVDYSAKVVIVPGFAPKGYHVTEIIPGILEVKYPLIFGRTLGGLLAAPKIPGYPELADAIARSILDADLPYNV
jgi:hypothetical protein